ncbi:MAG: RNA-binding protein, partial [Streptococcaceae bacterium]|nr:RNA-binding protein [Streptococcaceae bacterium]
MNENVYQHFRPDEHPFIDKVEGWIEKVDNQYAPFLTDFLDPRQQFIVETLVRQNSELKFMFYGGYEAAERKRACIYPEYYEPEQDRFEIAVFEIVYPAKFTELSHGKILGSLLATGMKRDYFGDIMTDGERWQVMLSDHTKNYIVQELTKVGKVNVRLEERTYTDIIAPKDEWQEESTTLSSLRLDNLIATVYNISRQRSKQLVDSGKVKVNWKEETRSDFPVELLDVISIRGFGRIQLRTIEGKTKKEKFRISFGVL